jgi:hypothetical protein
MCMRRCAARRSGREADDMRFAKLCRDSRRTRNQGEVRGETQALLILRVVFPFQKEPVGAAVGRQGPVRRRVFRNVFGRVLPADSTRVLPCFLPYDAEKGLLSNLNTDEIPFMRR